MQLNLFENIKQEKDNEQILSDLFQAYYDARKNKRKTVNQLKFELEYEKNLFELYDEIIEKRYKPKRSIAFIVNKPVKREIFAADFRDRVVHHLIFNYIVFANKLLTIYNTDSYHVNIVANLFLNKKMINFVILS